MELSPVRDYLTFDLLLVALPALLLWCTAPVGRRVGGPAALLAGTALLWTGPWDEHLVRTGVWTYAPGAVHARLGQVPLEEYLFVVLEVALVAAWARHVGHGLPTAVRPGARSRGALGWTAVAAAGLGLAVLGGPVRYLGLLLLWAGPPLALQRAVGGDVLAAGRRARCAVAVPAALWLCAADRLAIGSGIWAISPGSSTGLAVLGLPVEEAVFFGLTCLLVADGLLLAGDPAVLRRVRAGLPRSPLAGPSRERLASRT